MAAMATFEIRRGHAEAARVLVHQLSAPPAALIEALTRLDDELRRENEERARGAALLRTDESAGGRQRAVITALVSGAWAAFIFGTDFLTRQRGVELAHLHLVAANAAAGGAILAIVLVFRRRATLPPVSIRYLLTLTLMAFGASASWWLLSLVAVPLPVGFAVAALVVACVAATFTLFTDRWYALPTAVVVGGVPLHLIFPDATLLINGGIIALAAMLLQRRWSRVRR
jgi:hypothetical protein